MRRLEGRVAIVTGAGRGIGRAHALGLAEGGARVVVNDRGGSVDGRGTDIGPAEAVCEEIRAAGGEAVPSDHDVSDWDAGDGLVRLATDAFGGLDIVINNAGILRDRAFFQMTESEWDDVIAVHLKGHAAVSRAAVAYWRAEAKADRPRRASLIHTTSSSGLCGNFGQANYGAAKMGIVGLSKVIAIEGANYGIRSNVISPSARTRMTDQMTGVELLGEPDESGYDPFAPEHIANVATWLAEADCPANNQIFHVSGHRVRVLEIPRVASDLRFDRDLDPESIERAFAGRSVTALDAFSLIL
ncbi:MAG: SDR family NAD(P)-dependent oxidoreductase [Gemmatimonadetes bacterium]|nr:SDR family NAD(P)-dependent oxidoreductase [Gemmatimonadota bacterium]